MRPEEDRALMKAKLDLMDDPAATFFSVLILSLKHLWDETIATAMTDGRVIIYNPKMFMELSAPERIGVMLHEALHPALLHFERLGTRDRHKANRAMDYVINIIIKDAGFQLPDWVLYDEQYRGMTWEEVYELLPDDDPDFDPDMDFDGANQDPNLTQHIEDILVRAAQQAKQAGDTAYGNIPGELRRQIENLTENKVSWSRLLRHLMQIKDKSKRTFRKINRRFSGDFLLKGKQGRKLGKGAVFVDISGSMRPEQFEPAISETYQIMEELKPKEIQLIQFDTKVYEPAVITRKEDLFDVEFHDGGGTRIRPVMEWIEEHEPEWAIIFTDGDFAQCDVTPTASIIWLIHSNDNFSSPIGSVVHYPMPD